jgi:inward rectifier potassium channel
MSDSPNARKEPRERIIRIGDRKILTRGLERRFFGDLYHYCMTASWPQFFAGVAFGFILLNTLFALLYWLGDDTIANARPGHFIDFFYFSAETLGSVGYGEMYPQTDYGHVVATIEIFCAMGSVGVMAGLIFARFSRPRARILFARNPVITERDGQKTLMIRMANERHNMITDAAARLWLTQIEPIATGSRFRRFRELRLERAENPLFALSWTIFHAIDETSPFYGLDAAAMKEIDANLVLTFNGLDETSGQQVHARAGYTHEDLHWGRRYADILDTDDDGTPRIDYRHFHETLPQEE